MIYLTPLIILIIVYIPHIQIKLVFFRLSCNLFVEYSYIFLWDSVWVDIFDLFDSCISWCFHPFFYLWFEGVQKKIFYYLYIPENSVFKIHKWFWFQWLSFYHCIFLFLFLCGCDEFWLNPWCLKIFMVCFLC